MPQLRGLCAALVLVVFAGACTSQAPPPEVVTKEVLAAEGRVQPRDLVDLTIYYRRGRGRLASLARVIREVPVDADLPRTALTLLLEGPAENDPPALQAPLPTTSRIHRFAVSNGTANVVLSRHAVTDAHRVGKQPEHEIMALAAVANTLTEFPDIQRVKLRIDGQSGRRFWGTWGLPHTLIRDESVIEPQRRAEIPSLDEFSQRPQRIGVAQRRRRAPAISAVRVQSQSAYLRVTVEVTSATGGPLTGPVPPSSARRSGKAIVLRVRGVPSKRLAGSLEKQLRDPAFKSGRIDVTGRPMNVVVRLRPRRPSQYWLHTLSEPARVVLDVRR